MIYDFTMILLWFHYDQIYDFNMMYDFTMILLWFHYDQIYGFNMISIWFLISKNAQKNINKQKLGHIKTKLKS